MRIVILFFSIFLLVSCSKKSEATLDADELYLVAYGYNFPDSDSDEEYDWQFKCYGFSEIKSNFSTQIVRPKSNDSNFYKKDIVLSDSLKRDVNRMIAKYPNDSVFDLSESEKFDFLYCGPTYIFIIKKGNRTIHLSGIPYSLPQDIRDVLDAVYKDDDRDGFDHIADSDSIDSILKTIEQQIDRPDMSLPQKPDVNFIPPVITKG